MSLLIKGYVAASEINGYSIVRFGAGDAVQTATSKTQEAIGVVGQRGANTGEHVSVVELGEEFVRIGAAVSAGDRFICDASGHAIPLAASSGQTVHYVGVIKQSSTSVGAVVRCNVCPGTVIG